MNISPQTTASSPATPEGAAVASGPAHAIGSRELEHIDRWIGTAKALKLPAIGTLTAIYENLNSGSTEGYERLQRHPDQSASVPESAIDLEQRGVPTRLILGNLSPAHAMPGLQSVLDRGYDRMSPRRLTQITMPEANPAVWGGRVFTEFLLPAIERLKPNQAALLFPPNHPCLLVGKDDTGKPFAIESKGWDRADPSPARSHVLKDQDYREALHQARLMPTAPTQWAVLVPAPVRATAALGTQS